MEFEFVPCITMVVMNTMVVMRNPMRIHVCLVLDWFFLGICKCIYIALCYSFSGAFVEMYLQCSIGTHNAPGSFVVMYMQRSIGISNALHENPPLYTHTQRCTCICILNALHPYTSRYLHTHRSVSKYIALHVQTTLCMRVQPSKCIYKTLNANTTLYVYIQRCVCAYKVLSAYTKL